jgi:hypothetical protein
MEHTARGVDAQRLDRVPTTPGAITRLACARAKEAGIALEPLLQKAGLTVRQAEDLAVRLPVRAQIRFLELASTALEDARPELRSAGNRTGVLRPRILGDAARGLAARGTLQHHRERRHFAQVLRTQ